MLTGLVRTSTSECVTRGDAAVVRYTVNHVSMLTTYASLEAVQERDGCIVYSILPTDKRRSGPQTQPITMP